MVSAYGRATPSLKRTHDRCTPSRTAAAASAIRQTPKATYEWLLAELEEYCKLLWYLADSETRRGREAGAITAAAIPPGLFKTTQLARLWRDGCPVRNFG